VRIKLDENLPATLVGFLARLGHEADTVVDEGLKGEADEVVWPAAQNEGRFLVTQDLDFSDIRKFAPGTHRGLMLVRLRMPSRSMLERRVSEAFAVMECDDGWVGAFVVVSDRKLRVTLPNA
jgi:predicted nuclease of predicted toxin-antitoxin system